MRLILTIVSGARAGQRILLGPDETLRIGRTSQAAIAIADDPTMSSIHYEVSCSHEQATLLDLQSRNGLFVNGHQVAQAVLRSGDQIRAGRTLFTVVIEQSAADSGASGGHSFLPSEIPPAGFGDAAAQKPPHGTVYWPADAPSPWPAANGDSTLDSSFDRHLFEQPPMPAAESQGRLYAVVDGAVAQSLIQEAKRGSLRTESLLDTGASPYLAAVAPYLIEIAADSDFLARWRAILDKGPGVLLESQAGFDGVLAHARGLFCRTDDRGKPSFFRFYDPKLIFSWLSSCTSLQLAEFFGCLGGVIVGIDAGNRLLRLTRAGDELHSEEVFAQ